MRDPGLRVRGSYWLLAEAIPVARLEVVPFDPTFGYRVETGKTSIAARKSAAISTRR